MVLRYLHGQYYKPIEPVQKGSPKGYNSVMFLALKPSREDRKRIKLLTKSIAETIAEEEKNAKTKQEKRDAFSLAMAMTEEDRNELEHLRQKPSVSLLRKEGVKIPNEYWEATWYSKETLTSEGEDWTRFEANKLWRTNVEFWFKLIVPLIALVLSIIALVKKGH
jgi:lipopolysaccharide export LptBFGC system permease protein LptF